MRLQKFVLIGGAALGFLACSGNDSQFSANTTRGAAVPAESAAEEPVDNVASEDIAADTGSLEPEATPPPPAPEATVESSEGIEFGANEVFRIGDGKASDSSCLGEIDSFDLSGTTYFFEFEVAENATKIELNIAKLCGVDYEDSNFISLLDLEKDQELERSPLPLTKGEEEVSFTPFPELLLNKGRFAIAVSSEKISRDHDDFLVGKLQVKANKPVKAIRIFAEQ